MKRREEAYHSLMQAKLLYGFLFICLFYLKFISKQQ